MSNTIHMRYTAVLDGAADFDFDATSDVDAAVDLAREIIAAEYPSETRLLRVVDALGESTYPS